MIDIFQECRKQKEISKIIRTVLHLKKKKKKKKKKTILNITFVLALVRVTIKWSRDQTRLLHKKQAYIIVYFSYSFTFLIKLIIFICFSWMKQGGKKASHLFISKEMNIVVDTKKERHAHEIKNKQRYASDFSFNL